MALSKKKKKLLGLLTVGAVGGGLLYNMTGTVSGESSGNGNGGGQEEDEMVVATKIEEITGNQKFTFKEYSTNDAPASLNPFNALGGGKIDIRGSSGTQYEWKSGDNKLYLDDSDAWGWLGGHKSGAMHMKVAKGFAVKVKLVSENTDYFSEFSGLSEAIANRDSKIKAVGSSTGDTWTQIKDDIQRMWEDDEMSFMMYEGDYISIDTDSEWKGIAKYRIQIDGVKYDNGEGTIDDESYITLQKVYKVTPVDVWASETFTLGSETIVFSGAGAWLGRVGRKTWLRVASRVGTKASRKRAAKELDELVKLGFKKGTLVKGGKVTVTNIGKSSDGRLKQFFGRKGATKGAKEGGEFIGWNFMPKMTVGRGALILTVAVGGGLYTWIGGGGLGGLIKDVITGPPCDEVCSGYESGSDEETDCLEDCISSHDKRILVLGGIAIVGGLGVSYLLLSKLIPKKKAEKEE